MIKFSSTGVQKLMIAIKGATREKYVYYKKISFKEVIIKLKG